MQENFTITHVGHTELIQPMPFIYIPAKGKTFVFQADDGSKLGNKSEGLPITFENDFWMCAYQTTQEFWSLVLKASNSKELDAHPSHFKGKTRPVEQVSWDDIQIFNTELNKLHFRNKLIIKERTLKEGEFILPSETEWEYAANAEQGLIFAGSQSINDIGWFIKNCSGQTMPVGLKRPNAWGLFDMTGNVWEWCQDYYLNQISKIPKNGFPNLKIEQYKVLRGGSCHADTTYCRLRYRYYLRQFGRYFNNGFRLVFFPNFRKDFIPINIRTQK